MLYIIRFSYCLDRCFTCDLNGGPAKDSIDHLYVTFIEKQLLPELEAKAEKHATWWTFKPFSTLKTYLNEREIIMDEYFCLKDLQERVVRLLCNSNHFVESKKNINHYSNPDIIALMDEEQQILFDTYFIFVPHFTENYLKHHVMAAPQDIADALQNKHMDEDFYIESPMNILYKDLSSVWYLTPCVDFAINKSTGNVYSWSKALHMFKEFCFNNKEYFTRHSDTIIGINDNTCLSSIFNFKYFHLSQIELLLTKITSFLGRKNGMEINCHFLNNTSLFKSNKPHANVFTFIDHIINTNHDKTPLPSLPVDLYYNP